jgi:hypothetical protein
LEDLYFNDSSSSQKSTDVNLEQQLAEAREKLTIAQSQGKYGSNN